MIGRHHRLVAALAFAALLAGAIGPASAADTIKIGFSVSETGALAAPSIFDRQGYELAADELNAHGGLLGKKVELVHYDDQSTPSTAVSLYQKLISDDKVDLVLGPYSSQITQAVAPIVDRAKLVMPSMDANPEAFDGSHHFLFQAIAQTPQYMAPVIEFAARHGVKTIALLYQNSPFPQGLARGIKDEAQKRGLKIVFEEAYPPTTSDFGPLLLKAAATNPDLLVGGTFLADSEGIVRAAKAQNMHAKMYAFSVGPVEPEFSRALGSAAEGVFGNTLWFPTLTPYHEFVRAMYVRNERVSAIPAWLICDARSLHRYGLGMVRPHTSHLRRWIANGYLRAAPSLDALAATIGVDAAGLASTVERNNAFALSGCDADFDKGGNMYDRSNGDAQHWPNPCLGPIERPPFYAVAVHPTPLGTSAGIRTTADAQACDGDGRPIRGLYACGNDMEAPFGGEYPGAGAQLGAALTFGYLAALHALGRTAPRAEAAAERHATPQKPRA